MAKHPVPKKKVSNSRTAKRYASFALKKKKKIRGIVQIVKCKSCGNPMVNSRACLSCGNYRGRNIKDIKKAVEKITKVKA